MDLREYREAQKMIWASGDYRPIGRVLLPAAEALVETTGMTPGSRVLDIGVGSGNVTVTAAKTGADVVGIDITDAWWEEAYRQAREAVVELDLRIGDVEELPFEDGSFDYVLSSFAAIFAPHHEVVATELTRVCRPGGTIALNAWPPDGASQVPMRPLYDRLPEEEEFGEQHMQWGDPDHVEEVFRPHPVDLMFQRPTFVVRFPSERAYQDMIFENGPGFRATKKTLEDLGVWDEAAAEMHAILVEINEASDGTYTATWDYLQIVGLKTS